VVEGTIASEDTEVRGTRLRQSHLEIPLYNPKLTRDAIETEDDHQDHRGAPRRRQEQPPHMRIRRRLLGLAESPLQRVAEEVVGVARLVADNDDDAVLREQFVDLCVQVALEQPLKTPFVAAVVLVVNTLKPEIALEILRKAAGGVERAVEAGQWREVKLGLKLLACLQAMLDGDGLFPVLEELFSRAVDLQTASSDDVSCPSESIYKVLSSWG
jgi:nuclear cap-binding protein subunit 1